MSRLAWLPLCTPRPPLRPMLMPGTDMEPDTDTAMLPVPTTTLDTGMTQEGRGHWTIYYTSPKSFILMFSYSLV